MPNYTTNLNLELPLDDEQYDVAVTRRNNQLIDDFAGLTPPRALTADKLTQSVNINGVAFSGDSDVVTGLGIYSSTVNYSQNQLAYKVIDEKIIVKRSMINDNLGNDFNNENYWIDTGFGGDFANTDLSNLTTVANSKFQFAPFSINQGTILNGKNNTLTYSNTIITCNPCTITTTDGRTKIFNTVSTIDVSGQLDGSYSIFKGYETGELSLVNGISISKTKDIQWVQPKINSNGTPLIDDFAVSASDEYLNYSAYEGTKGNTLGWTNNNDFVSGQENSWYQLVFKEKVKISSLSLNSFRIGSYIYYIVDYVIKASNEGTNWTTIYTGTNTAGDTTSTFVMPVNSSDYYHYYRIIPTSVYSSAGPTTGWTIQNLTVNGKYNFSYWLDISTIPANLKVYNDGTYAINNDLVYIGDCTISNGIISTLTNREFNNSGYLIEKYFPSSLVAPDLSKGINKSTSGFTADEDGWVYVAKYGGSTGDSIYIDNAIVLYKYGSTGVSGLIPILKGQTLSATSTFNECIFYPFKQIII